MQRLLFNLLFGLFFVSAQRVTWSNRTAWASSLSQPKQLPNVLPVLAIYGNTSMLVQSSINAAGEQDFFKFRSINQAAVTIYSSGSTKVYGAVYRAVANTLVVENDNISADNDNFRLAFNATSWTDYVLMVRGDDASVAGPYDIHFVSSVIDDYGDDREESFKIVVPPSTGSSSISGMVHSSSDIDYFHIVPIGDGRIQLKAQSSVSILGILYGSTNPNYYLSYSEPMDIVYQVKGNSSYWLYVKGSMIPSGSMAAYTITISFTTQEDLGRNMITDRSAWVSSISSPRELPSLVPGASYLSSTRLIFGSALTANEYEYYSFVNIRDGQVTIYSVGSVDTYCTVYESDGTTVVVENDDSDPDNNNHNFLVTFDAIAETQYIIEIRGFDEFENGNLDIYFQTNAVEDFGNSVYEAYEITLVDNVQRDINMVLDWPADYDAFLFTAEKKGTVTIWSEGWVDTYAFFYGTDLSLGIIGGFLLEDDDDGFGNDDSWINYRFTYDVLPGYDYWLLSGSWENIDMGSHTVHFLFEPHPLTNGIDLGTVYPLPNSPRTYQADLAAGAMHYYRVKVASEEPTFTVRAVGNATLVIDIIRYYAGTGNYGSVNTVATNNINGTNSVLIVTATDAMPAGEIVYLTVNGETVSDSGSYRLEIFGSVAEDFANTRELAHIIIPFSDGTKRSLVRGSMSYTGDEDAFMFVAPENGTLTVKTLNAGIDSYGTLMDAHGNVLISDNDGGDGANFQIETEIIAGKTYYLSVRAFLEVNQFNYTVEFMFPNKPVVATVPFSTATLMSAVPASSTVSVDPSDGNSQNSSQSFEKTPEGLAVIVAGGVLGAAVLSGLAGVYGLRSKHRSPTITSTTLNTVTGATTTMSTVTELSSVQTTVYGQPTNCSVPEATIYDQGTIVSTEVVPSTVEQFSGAVKIDVAE